MKFQNDISYTKLGRVFRLKANLFVNDQNLLGPTIRCHDRKHNHFWAGTFHSKTLRECCYGSQYIHFLS